MPAPAPLCRWRDSHPAKEREIHSRGTAEGVAYWLVVLVWGEGRQVGVGYLAWDNAQLSLLFPDPHGPLPSSMGLKGVGGRVVRRGWGGYIHICAYMYIYIYIYIYTYVYIYVCRDTYVYIYIYIYNVYKKRRGVTARTEAGSGSSASGESADADI